MDSVAPTSPGESPEPLNKDPNLISVGVFGYNQEQFIAEAVSSVLSQSHTNLDIMIVDDGSSDRTLDRIHSTVNGDYRVRVFHDGANTGLVPRMNLVLAAAKGQWLTVLGGDDAYLPTGIAEMARASEPGVSVIWGDLEVMGEHGRSKGYARPRDTWQGATARKYVLPARPLTDILRVNNFISGTTPMIRTEVLRNAGGYTEGTRNEDLDLWLRLAPDHLFRYVDTTVGRYRVVSGSSSRSEKLSVLDQAEIFRRFGDDPRYPQRGLGRLLAMRWALSVARSKGRPPVSLPVLSAVSGIPIRVLRRQLPSAAAAPLSGSVVAAMRKAIWHNRARSSNREI